MIKFTILFLLFAVFAPSNVISQDRYFVIFKDKDGVEFDPYVYFDQKAIDRRKKLSLPLDHFTDKPLNQNYVYEVGQIADTLGYQLRWINAVAATISYENVASIKSLKCVKEVVPMRLYDVHLAINDDEFDQGELILARAQIKRMKGDEFEKKGLTGKGVRIAILDAGFPGVNYLPYFKHIRDNDRLISHYDFVKNKPETFKGHKHGTMVLGNIAGKVGNIKLGMAVDAEFLLARTESMLKEGISDEETWLKAVEWADKNGADIINCSLGYTKRLYFRGDMDGKTSFITKAANMAARKGILVVNSAGNEGKDADWVTIAAPADADSVLAVGAINPWTNLHTSWSSFGPSADKRLKPNVCAYGHTTVAISSGIQEVTGTSFASPLTAGFAACAWQSDSSLTNMDLFKAIEKSGELYPYYDYAHGYGVPQATYFTKSKSWLVQETFKIIEDSLSIKIMIDSNAYSRATLPMAFYYTQKDADGFSRQYGKIRINTDSEAFLHVSDEQFSNSTSGIRSDACDYFLYHIENSKGYLDKYYVIGVEQMNVLTLKKSELKSKTVRFYYKGFINSIKL